ncbi:C2 domain containing protein [Gigaspora margarita]|uniref:C2 domain containing protein n=1 Tax=Gigaspora margarita TaxID=4874 RepID=A0A8H3XD14_GIGMA|nr:C2 domain containing protein [Gigaspora margarita]
MTRGRGILAIHVVEGRNFKKTDKIGHGDPYVEVWLDNSTQKSKTDVRRNTRTPVWDRKFYYNVCHQSELHVTVMDADVITHDDLIGTTTINITDIYKNYYQDMWVSLPDVKGKHRDGQLRLVIEFFPR